MSTTEDEEYEKQLKRLEAHRKRMEADGYYDDYEYSRAELLEKREQKTASAPYANGYYYMQETVPNVKDQNMLKKGKPVKSSAPMVKARGRGTTSSEGNQNEGCIIL